MTSPGPRDDSPFEQPNTAPRDGEGLQPPTTDTAASSQHDADPASAAPPEPAISDGPEWQRLSQRVVWVDLIWSLLALTPAVVAVVWFNLETTWSAMWPFYMIAFFGVTGAIGDIVRWVFTRFRITDAEVELRTGVLVRKQRRVYRDRIRSVDTHAKLRHRVGRLRVVTIGAGQQMGAGESAFLLDALTREDAQALRHRLLDTSTAPVPAANATTVEAADGDDAAAADSATATTTESEEVFATFRPWWVVYNLFSIWTFFAGLGILWGATWFLSSFGVDLYSMIAAWIDRFALDWVGILVGGLLGGGIVGVGVMGVSFLTGYWNFSLARVRSGEKSYLRTRRGLISTREVSRDEARMRGLSIGEPVVWRWMGMADTNVITTGLNVWDAEEPSAILPRGPISVARDVARKVLGPASPMDAPLRSHPRAALRRRLWWATVVGLGAVAAVAWPVASGTVPMWVLWIAVSIWPLALLAAVIAYRALGHTISGDYLVVRAGLLSRTTSVLRRDAVSTIAIRQSVLQKRLKLCTVNAMTAAGWSVYEAPDVAEAEALPFAVSAAPGLVDEFLLTEESG